MCACTKNTDLQEFSESSETNAHVIGPDRANPYALDNMQLAYNSVRGEFNLPALTLSANGLYVEVNLQDVDDEDLMATDTSVVVFDYPMHREIITPGSYSD